MYIDESGDTIPLSKKGKQFLVLTGCIIHESKLQEIEENFRKIKEKYYQSAEVEIKSNFLRYANPDLEECSPLKLNSRNKYDDLEAEMTKFLTEIPVDLYSVAISKESYWNQYPAQNPYHIAYVFLLERFQKYLESKRKLGVCIIDPREGQVEKHFIGNELSELHNKMRWYEGKIWSKCPNVVEKLLFSQSDQTVGIQLADLYCYPTFHVLEYNKARGEYWRFKELTYPKLIKSKSGIFDGYGLKIFPDNTKKGLKLLK
ncbi:DUF3800 domain-containing protein [Patescibacteria group bacterium]